MTKRLIATLAVCLAPFTSSCQADASTNPQGSLVIVGGGLRASNQAIYQEFIDRSRGRKIGIIPAASGKPTEAANTFRNTLISYGVESDRIQIIPIAWRDDSTTPDIEESTWRKNAWKDEVVESISELGAIWFTGGDQSRITSAITDENAEPSPALETIRQVYAQGAVIGGTSAGAAIQSKTMILGGTSLQAFDHGTTQDYPGMESQENGPLVIGKGLGFFTHGIIDQHFDRKARLGRLIVALLKNPWNQRFGYGIDEDTALVYDATKRRASVVGAGAVVAINASHANRDANKLENIKVSVLGPGDQIAFPTHEFTINSKMSQIESEYLSIEDAHLSSLFSPYSGRLEEALGFLLLDNSQHSLLETRVPMANGGERSIIFRQTAETQGYWGYLDGQRDSYSILNVTLSISPPPANTAEK